MQPMTSPSRGFRFVLALIAVAVCTGPLTAQEQTTSQSFAPPSGNATGTAPGSATAAPPAKKPEEKKLSDEEKAIQAIKRSDERVRRAAASLKGQPFKEESVDGKLLVVCEPIEIGVIYNGSNSDRFIVGQIKLFNGTDKPVTLEKNNIRLSMDNKVSPQSNPDLQRHNYSFSVGNTHHSFSDLKRPEKTTVAPGKTGETWFLFIDVSMGSSLPRQASVNVTVGGEKRTLDLREQLLGQLGFSSERIGPGKALALFRVAGQLNIASLSVLADQMDRLVEDHVSRLVIAWDKGAPNVQSDVGYFLFRYASNAGYGNERHHDQRFPVLPNSLREVHLCRIPGSHYSSGSGRKVTHDSLDDAVAAALWTALEKLPEDLLLDQIERGHPLVRPAALSAGSSRLSPGRLPLVLQFARDRSAADMQSAAIYALRNFGAPAAVETLIGFARDASDDKKPLVMLAVASLAASRYETAQRALDELIAASRGEQRLSLLRVLAANPLPKWADLFYENASDPKSKIRVESFRALNSIGHEQLTPLLKSALFDENKEVRDVAFSIVLSRRDPELEPLLERIVLKKLVTEIPDGTIQNYLRQTRNPKAVPLLLRQLRKNKSDQGKRQSLIQILVEIADDSVAEELYSMYNDISGYEKSRVLAALQQMESPRFLELARKALAGKDSSEIYAAINGLQMTDSPEAEKLLLDAFERKDIPNYYDNIAGALSQIGSAEAERALRAARRSDIPQKSAAAKRAFRYLLQRRPGFQFVNQAYQFMFKAEWKKALDAADFAVEADPTFSWSHSLRGVMLLRLNRIADARKAFEEAKKLDDENPEALVGLKRVDIREGKHPQQAIDAVERMLKDYESEYDYHVQAALAYADALKTDDPTGATDESKKRVRKYESRVLYNIAQAVSNGLPNRQLIENAPELEPFKNYPDYPAALQGDFKKDQEAKSPPPKQDGAVKPAVGEAAGKPNIVPASRVIMLPAPPVVVK